MVTHVSSTELTVSLSVSPLRMNSSVAILYFPSLHFRFYFGAFAPYLSSEVTNEKAESQFNFFFFNSFLHFAPVISLWPEPEAQQQGACALHVLVSKEEKDPEQLCSSRETQEVEGRE